LQVSTVGQHCSWSAAALQRTHVVPLICE
jgi:hypothetical protein